MSKFKTYSANHIGRDFICSDIHGHFTLLEEHLSNIDFDTSKDRLFCLGDLIDRGDESASFIDYLNKPFEEEDGPRDDEVPHCLDEQGRQAHGQASQRRESV